MVICPFGTENVGIVKSVGDGTPKAIAKLLDCMDGNVMEQFEFPSFVEASRWAHTKLGVKIGPMKGFV